MLEQVEWGEFRLWSLFDVDSWIYGKNKQYDTRISDPTDNSIAVVSWITENNWVNYYTEDKLSDNEIFEWELTISTRWEYSWTVFYHNKKFVLANNILVMFMPWLTKNQKLFLWSIINSLSYWWYSWYPRKETLKEDVIQLPIKNWKIDFEFMDKFIAELEAERQAELEAYLKTTWLKNYELTSDELNALKDFENWKIKWKEFKIWDLFERINTVKLPYKAKDLPQEPTDQYIIPCLTSSFMNQGLNYYVPREWATILKNVISIPSNSDVYRAYYQSNEFTVLSDAYAIRWILDDKILPIHYLFLVSCINQVTDLPIYSYKNKLGWRNVVQNKSIYIPIIDNKPNYEFMKNFTYAIEKLTIKDVVLYSNKKIEATKKVINNN